MFKWVKSKFVKKKNTGFTGFRIETYVDGKLVIEQYGGLTSVMYYNAPGGLGRIVNRGTVLYGYTLTPHLESI